MEPDDLSGGQAWALASLRILSETLSSEAIGERLGLRATSTRTSEGDPSFTVWMLESRLEPTAGVEDHLYILMERLADRRDALKELAEQASVEMWLSFSPGVRRSSSVLDHAVLAELGALGIDLVLDPYPPGGAKS
jgi:hypothetical protein